MCDESLEALEAACQGIPDNNESDEEAGDSISIMECKDGDDEDSLADRQSLTSRYPLAYSQVAPSSILGGGGGLDKEFSLRHILHNQRRYQLFRRFLQHQCITRNLKFWLSCEGYKHISPERRPEGSRAIYYKYLKSSAPLYVAIQDQTLRKIKINIRLNQQLFADLFDSAQLEMYHMMEQNELRQFVCSDIFTETHNQSDADAFCAEAMPSNFQPATYRAGSPHSSSEESYTYTSAE